MCHVQSGKQFVDSTDPRFIPMSNVRVRWLADRRLAGRYPFALIQRSQILGVATEGTGAPKAARARRRAAVAAAEAALAAAEAQAADAAAILAGRSPGDAELG